MCKLLLPIGLLVVMLVMPARAQLADSNPTQLLLHVGSPGPTISRDIYGQFAEHLGRGIYGGVWVGEDSKIPNVRGIRSDVVAALKNLRVPIVRWPGGCFADEYHWRDGIGPRAQRPRTINSHWGGVVETNAFGTHEFMDFCQQIGAEPYIAANVGSGSVREMMDWIEYMTSDSDSTLVELRRKNGQEKPWKIKYLGIGNESWGCGGDMRPEFYSDLFRQYNQFVKDFGGNHILRIACGPDGSNFNWTDVLMREVGGRMNGLSMHYYTLPTGNWQDKGAAVGFTEDQWASTLQRSLEMNELITRHAAIMDRYDPGKQVGLMVDEWGNWYDPAPGSNPGFLEQQNTLRDAITAGVNLNIFNEHADRVKMACIAQMVNVLQAMILTDQEKMVLTPTYWVYEMYKVHQGATSIPLELTSPAYRRGRHAMAALSASASRDSADHLHLSIVNLDPDQAIEVSAKIAGAVVKSVSGQILTAAAMDAHNTFDNPDAVKPASFHDFQLRGETLDLNLPAKSIVVVDMH